MFKVKRNKYNNKRMLIDGIWFASKKEGQRYLALRMAESQGQIKDLQMHPEYPFPMGFKYIADFSYIMKGKQIVEDVKGMETAVFRLKKKCFNYFYKNCELKIVR